MAEAAAQQLPGDDWKDIHPAEAQASPYAHGDDWHDIAPPVSLDEFAGPKITETPLYKAGESIQKLGRETFPVSEEERAAHPYASAIGRTAGAVLPAAAATLGLGPAGVLAGAAQMGTSAEADTFDDALAHGADERTASKAAGISGALGMALGAVDLGVVLAPLRRSLPGMTGWAAQKLAQAGQSGITFAAVGQAQQYLNTEIEKEIYNPDATYSPQFKDMLAAFVVGGGLGAVHPLRPREAVPATDVSDVVSPGDAPRPAEGRLEAPPEPAVAPPPLAKPAPAATRESLRETLDRGAPLSELVQHPYVRHVDEQNKNAVPTGTEEDFVNPEWRAQRVYDFDGERVEGWNAAVDRLTDRAKLYAGPEGVENGRRATIIIGPPAAGKSGTAMPMARTFRAAVVDADDAKLVISEYQGGLGTDAVHEESSYMAKDVVGRLFDDGANVVLPKVGQNADSIAKLINVLQERLGYKVDLVHVAATPEISGRRNIERLYSTGRLVSPDLITQIGDKPRETYHLLKGQADDFADINTAVDPRETREASAGLAHAVSDGRNLVEDHVAGGDRGRGAQGAAREEAQVKPSVHDQGLQADKIDLPTKALFDRLGLPHSIEELRPQDIGADPARFQYKAGADTATGETKAGAISIGRWKGQRTPAMVWRDNDGKDWIVDGHHRLNVGKKLANIDPSVRLGAIVINEADISAADAKALGQQRNEAREASKLSGIQQHHVTAADGTTAEVFPLVLEADRAITSQDAGYDKTLQPRERRRAASQAQVRDIATSLDPERLGYSAEADRSAPIIGSDGMVESGNGRVLAIRRVYEQNGPKAQAYRDWLTKQGVDVSKFRNPILVRQRLTPFTPEQRRAFTVAANQPATLAMSAPERAMADARLIDSNSLNLIVNPDDLSRNRDSIRKFIAQLPQTEQGTMADARGALSSEGVMRLRNAVVAKVYGDAGILTRIAESTNDEIKSISNALVAAAPRWARMRAEIEAGNVRSDVDLTPDLVEAVKRTADIRTKGQKLNEYLAQVDAFDKLSDTVEAFMRNFYDPKGRRAAGAERIRDVLRFYADEAAKVNAEKGLDLGLVKVEPRDILNLAQKKGWPDGREGRDAERGGAGDGPREPAGSVEARGSFLAPGREYTGAEGAEGYSEAAERAQRGEVEQSAVNPTKDKNGNWRVFFRGIWGPDKVHELSGGLESFTDVFDAAEKYATEVNDPVLFKEYQDSGAVPNPRVIAAEVQSQKPFVFETDDARVNFHALRKKLSLSDKEAKELLDAFDWMPSRHQIGWRLWIGREYAQEKENILAGKHPETGVTSYKLADSPTFHQILRKRGYDAILGKGAFTGGEPINEVRPLDPSIVKRVDVALLSASVGAKKDFGTFEDFEGPTAEYKRASGGRVSHLKSFKGGAASISQKRKRDSFGYMEPSPNIPDFAQCGSCQLWIKDRDRCYWFSDSKKVEASDSCTEYVQGEPIKGDVKASNSLDPKEAGFIKGSTRCENCVSFNKDKSSCMLFEKLNRAQPDIFDLDEKVKPRGCCNAFSRDPARHEKVVRRASGGRVDPKNINPNPTPAQAKAGNYAKDRIHVHGMEIVIENAKGSMRRGIGKDGKPWAARMPPNAHYGYIRRLHSPHT